MILHQSLERTLLHISHFHAEAFGSLFEFAFKGPGYRPHKVQGQPWSTILLYIAYEEVGEALHQQPVHFGHLTMFREEGRQASQEAVCQGLAVYPLQYDFLRESILGKEFISDILGQLVLEAVSHEAASPHSTATLIAEDIP